MNAAALPELSVWDDWVEDLVNYRDTLGGTGYRWDSSDVLRVVDRATHDQREFVTMLDLNRLDQSRDDARDFLGQTRRGLIRPMHAALQHTDLATLAETTYIPLRTLRSLTREADYYGEGVWGSALSERAARDRGPNPLILMWEIRQASDLASAAYSAVNESLSILLWQLHHDWNQPMDALVDVLFTTTGAQARARIRRRDRLSLTGRDPRLPSALARQHIPGPRGLMTPAAPTVRVADLRNVCALRR